VNPTAVALGADVQRTEAPFDPPRTRRPSNVDAVTGTTMPAGSGPLRALVSART